METVAVGWLILDITESPFMVDEAAAARMARFFFLGILSGVMSDHLDRRGFLIGINSTGCIMAGIMALILLSGEVRVWPVIVLVAAGGCVLAFALTTRQAYTYDVVGPSHALNGLSLASMAMQAGGIVGSLASGVLIGAFGPRWLYVVVGVSYIAATVVLLGTGPIVESVKAHRESILSNLAGYVRIIMENRILLVLMCLASITEVLGFTHMMMLPVFAKEVLFVGPVGPVGLGVMTAVCQGGGFVGLTLLASLRDYRRKGMLMCVIAGAFGLALMAFSLSTNLFFFLAVLAVVNGCAMAVDTLYKALMQENVAEEERGRAMGS
jgi:MFS family permease